MILVPEVLVCTESMQCDHFQMQYESLTLPNGEQQNRFFLDHDQISGTINQIQKNIGYGIYFFECSDSDFRKNNKQFICAEQQEIDNYINSQINMISVKFLTTQFDTKTKKLYKIPKTIDKYVSQFQQYKMNLQVNNLQVDDGILFNNYNFYSYISDYQVETIGYLTTVISRELQQSLTLHMILEINFDQIKTSTLIEYPKISEILADTGAIISWILQISYIVSKYNEKIYTDKTINEVIKMYFPDILDLTMKKNLFGRMISVQIKDKYYDPQRVDRLIRRITDIAHSKVSFINLQYEITRLQFFLEKQFGIACMKNTLHQENKIENFLDTFDYRIKPNQPDSIINISQGQIDNSIKHENLDSESFETQFLESSIGLNSFLPDLQKIIKVKKSKIQKELEFVIIPKECLKQEDISGLNSIN